LPGRYIIKFCIPLGILLLLLQAIALLADAALVLTGRKELETQEEEPGESV
jgi:TRAP-type mannitol/chloroaromatic compound transport system permease small subunit